MVICHNYSMKMKILGKMRIFLFFIFVAAMIVGLLAYSAWGDKLPIEETKNFVAASDLAPWIFMLLYVGLSVFFPTTPMMALSGILFGFGYGLLFTSIAGFASAIFTFF